MPGGWQWSGLETVALQGAMHWSPDPYGYPAAWGMVQRWIGFTYRFAGGPGGDYRGRGGEVLRAGHPANEGPV